MKLSSKWRYFCLSVGKWCWLKWTSSLSQRLMRITALNIIRSSVLGWSSLSCLRSLLQTSLICIFDSSVHHSPNPADAYRNKHVIISLCINLEFIRVMIKMAMNAGCNIITLPRFNPFQTVLYERIIFSRYSLNDASSYCEIARSFTAARSWWRHQIKTFSRVTGHLFGEFIDLRLNERLSEQRRGWWFETSWRPLWRHCNVQVWSQFFERFLLTRPAVNIAVNKIDI